MKIMARGASFLSARTAMFNSRTPVVEEEREGYQMWKEAGGEVFP